MLKFSHNVHLLSEFWLKNLLRASRTLPVFGEWHLTVFYMLTDEPVTAVHTAYRFFYHDLFDLFQYLLLYIAN